MYIPYQFQYQSNEDLFISYTRKQGVEQNLIFHLTQALDSIADPDRKLDFFLGVNAATLGSLYSYIDAIKLMSNNEYKNMFVVYWHLCADRKPQQLPDWVNKLYKTRSSEQKQLLTKMRAMLKEEPENRPAKKLQTVDDFDDVSADSAKRPTNYYTIVKISCIALAALGTIALGLSLGAYFAGPLSWLGMDTITLLISLGSTCAVGGAFGFFVARYQEQNDLFWGKSALNPTL